jgi:Transposase DDE domain
MHATKVLQKILTSVIARLDLRNTRNLLFAIEALLVGRRLTLMELARHFPGAERVGAPLKRFDRLLGNRSVQAARASFYKEAATWLLRTAVSARGRALTLYEEVHPEQRKCSPEVEAQFLRQLQTLLPHNTRPILVADAGFRVPWFRMVESLGWHWVGRVRGTTRLCFSGKSRWIPCRRLFAEAGARARSLGEVRLTESNPIPCRLVLMKRRRGGRHHHTRHGQRARGGHSEKMAARIVKLYARRMQIEQSFRDLKSHRYGCAFEDTLTRDPKRLEMLLHDSCAGDTGSLAGGTDRGVRNTREREDRANDADTLYPLDRL